MYGSQHRTVEAVGATVGDCGRVRRPGPLGVPQCAWHWQQHVRAADGPDRRGTSAARRPRGTVTVLPTAARRRCQWPPGLLPAAGSRPGGFRPTRDRAVTGPP
jgi:hypothetical protein